MNRPDEPSTDAELEPLIDRLVADDLPDAIRRSLLETLETHPEHWRRCALAFLEDQAWRSACTEMLHPTVFAPDVPTSRSRIDRRNGPRASIRFALAAGLAALIAGGGYQLGLRSSRLTIASESNRTSQISQARTAEKASVPGEPLGWVGLIQPGDGEALPRQVPILAATEANRRWLAEQPASIPDYVKAQWERRGYQLEENRRLVGLDLQDGSHVAIPVDQLDLDFVGRQPL